MGNKIKIYNGNYFPGKGIFILLFGLIFFHFTGRLHAQNNILYVSPRIESAISSNIAQEIENKITNKIPYVKQKVSFRTYSDPDGQNICNSKITASSVKYMLKLDNIKNIAASPSYELEFSLNKISRDNLPAGKLFTEEEIPWENSTFIVKKNGELSKEIDEILTDLKNEIEYYFKNEIFRSRIYINPDDFKPAEEDFYTAFSDWLEKELNEAENSKPSKYIIYYDSRPYPQNNAFILIGKFTDPVNKIASVEFTILKDGKPYKVKPVNINVEDFEYGSYEHDAEYKQAVINKIYELLSKIH